MALHYDNPDPLENAALRTQRMTADEASSVIALWQQERVAQTGLTDRPAVPDVAEGLDVPVEEVQRLLGEVRARRLEEERALVQEQELAQAEVRLAEEEFGLASIQQRRAELRRKRGRSGRHFPRQLQAEYTEEGATLREAQRQGSSFKNFILFILMCIALAYGTAVAVSPHQPDQSAPICSSVGANGQETNPHPCSAEETFNISHSDDRRK